MVFKCFGLCFEINTSIHNEKDMSTGTWKELASASSPGLPKLPLETHAFLHWRWRELSWGTWTFSSLQVGQMNSSPPPHLPLDADNISLLWRSCLPVSVPCDTGENWSVCVGSSYVSETVGTKMSLSLSSSVSCVSSRSKAGHSSHIWMQWFIWWERRVHIWCLGTRVRA